MIILEARDPNTEKYLSFKIPTIYISLRVEENRL
jgi:hypothetical protein